MGSGAEELRSRVRTLLAEFMRGGGTNYIDDAIAVGREVLRLCPHGHPQRSVSLASLSILLSHRYGQLGAKGDVEEGIMLDREALALWPTGHPDRTTSLNNLANWLSHRFKKLGKIEDLSEAIILCNEALALYPPRHRDRSMPMNNLASHLSTRYEHLGDMNDLNQAIILDREALGLLPPGHPSLPALLNNLALHLTLRYDQLGGIEHLNEATLLNREALAICPPGHPDRSISLNNLANRLYVQYKEAGGIEGLNEAIVLGQEALVLCPLGHPDRPSCLNNLAVRLSTRYRQLGGIEDLNDAVALHREVLALRPSGNPDRPSSLNNLASDLSTRYRELGGVEDLDEAIVLDREALVLRPPGHPHRPLSLNNLASHLSALYTQLGGVEDLDEAIGLDREALVLCPPGHPGHSASLSNLADSFSTRFVALGWIEDLDEAIILDREALALRPPGHPDRPTSLNNLAVHLSMRYIVHIKLGRIEDLNEVVVIGREALALHPRGHPSRSACLNNLATHLSIRYKQLGDVEDLNEAIALGREALELCPLGHSDRSRSLKKLANYLHDRFSQLHRPEDREELFDVYAKLVQLPHVAFSMDLSAARAWACSAEDLRHPSILLAYKTALRLLVHHLAILPPLPEYLTVFKACTSSLAADAFSACLRNHVLTSAVELLEQGRGVFWSQLTRLQSPLDDVITSGPAGRALADEFTRITSLIHNALRLPGVDQRHRMFHLNVGLKTVVARIRELPGLSRFLLPLPFSDLRRAAREGPVIIANASQFSCDALVVFYDQDPVHIPLSITKVDVQELASNLHTLTVRAKSMDVTRDFGRFLRRLWDDVVFPIVDFLQTVHPRHSRIWWCPTAEFSLLPLHAAGPYRKGQQNLADFYVSSYTPTLSALIRARRHDPSRSAKTVKRFVAIGQAAAAGQSKLASVGSELANIGQRVNGLATYMRIDGSDSSIARVTEALGRSDWVHFACHGIPKQKEPFQSAFALHDGHFTIQQIIQCTPEDPEFAYLSACHTTVGDEESPDEMIHLASAMQFAGFRSVVGTMWAVDDGETSKITSMFYDNMKDDSGRLDYTRAALALNKTMRKMADIPFDQRILYIHLGA